MLITIFNAETLFLPIVKLLSSNGYEKMQSFYDLDSAFHEQIGDFFWLTRRDYYREHEGDIRKAYKLSNDERSRDTFEASLRLRLDGNFTSFETLGYDE